MSADADKFIKDTLGLGFSIEPASDSNYGESGDFATAAVLEAVALMIEQHTPRQSGSIGSPSIRRRT
jgi:hypothetical protein